MPELASKFVQETAAWSGTMRFLNSDHGLDDYEYDRVYEGLEVAGVRLSQIAEALDRVSDEELVEFLEVVCQYTAHLYDSLAPVHQAERWEDPRPRMALHGSPTVPNGLRVMATLLGTPARRSLMRLVELLGTYIEDLEAFEATVPHRPWFDLLRELDNAYAVRH